MTIKTLSDVAVPIAETTITVPTGKRWLIEKIIVSNLTNTADANKANCWLTLKFNDNPKMVKYPIAGESVYTMPIPYILESTQTIKLTAQTASQLQVAIIGSEE